MGSLKSLTIFVTIDAYLSTHHLKRQIQTFNSQTSNDFEVFFLNQRQDRIQWNSLLENIQFDYHMIDLPYPYLKGVCCWELVGVMGSLTETCQSKYMTYLHQECLPALNFVSSLIEGIEAVQNDTGKSNHIYILNQLRCSFTEDDLGVSMPEEMSETPLSWVHHRPWKQTSIYQKQNWEEDAFALSMDWVKAQCLFSCVNYPLYFLDLFDLMFQLESMPLLDLEVYRLGHPIIYHLNHKRVFKEYTQEFLECVKTRPDLFGHLALYELAHSDFDYSEPFEGKNRIIHSQIHKFLHYMKYSEKGTVTLWGQSLMKLLITKG